MIRTTNKLLLIFFFLLLSSAMCHEDQKIQNSVGEEDLKTHVLVRNDLHPNVNLTIHCKSKNDDLGSHVLTYQSTYEFSFLPNFWRTTLYFCSFQWPPNEFHWLDIFVGGSDACKLCQWSLYRPDGLCRFNSSSKKYDECYSWNKGK